MFKCTRCPDLEKRIDNLMAVALEERKLLYASMERERAQWAREREALLTRIQAWSPNPDGAPEPAPSSQEEGERETVDGVHTQEELAELGLVVNSDGGYVDTTLSPPMLYESVEDCLEVRAFLRKQKLPAGTHPGLLTEGGIGEIIEMARQSAKNGKAEEETT